MTRRTMRRLGALTLLGCIAYGCAAERGPHSKDAKLDQSRPSEHASNESKKDDDAVTGADEESAKGGARRGLGPQGPDVLIGSPASASDAFPNSVPDPSAQNALLVAIDTPYEIFEGQGTYVHVAAWRPDGAPASSSIVYAGDVPVGKTDAHGSLVFLYPPKQSKNPDVLAASQITVVDAQDDTRRGTVGFGPNVRTASFASDHLFVYTDRGVYRPGDLVRVRMIGWHLKEDYSPLIEKEIELTLEHDETGQVVGGGKRTTDAFGIASADIRVPTSASEGLYELVVRHGGATRTARLQIRDYSPPRVNIRHDLGRFITKKQPTLTTAVELEPSSGGAFGKGTLTLAATSNGRTAFSIEREVSGKGPHTFEVSRNQLDALKGMTRTGAYATLELTLEADGVIDEVERQMRYVDSPFVAVLETDKDQYTTGEKVMIVAKVRDLDGVPMREEEVTLIAGEVEQTKKTNGSGSVTFEFEMPAGGVNAMLRHASVSEPIASAPLRWIEQRAMVSKLADATIKERRSARVKVRFPANIVPAEKVVHMDVVDTTGALVNAVLLPITEENGEVVAVGEFEAPSWGSMLLTFFALGKDTSAQNKVDSYSLGLLTEGQNLVVHPDRELEIVLDGVPDEAAPGQTVRFGATVRDVGGKMVSASVGASVVESRALAMKDPLEITPMDVFYEPTLRTMSTTGSKILSWPVVSRNWGPSQIDIALPPFAYHPGGVVAGGRRRAGNIASNTMAPGSPPPAPTIKKPKKSKTSSGGGASLDGLLGGAAEMPPMEEAEADDVSSDLTGVVAGQGRRSRAKDEGQKPVTITIRTNFDETSMWRPHRVAQGKIELSATMPDAITNQTLTLVASDASGGVGIARATIDVTRPLHVDAFVPPTLAVGESLDVPVVVTNGSKTKQEVTLKWASQTPGVSAKLTPETLEVAAGSSATAIARIETTTPGLVDYTIEAKAGALRDALSDEIRVMHTGAPTESITDGLASEGSPFEAKWKVASADNDAYLQVTFPAITADMLELDAFHATLRDDPLSLSSDLVSACALLAYASTHGIESTRLELLRERVTQAVGTLGRAMHPSGAWAYWRRGLPSPYVTAWILEGFTAAHAIGINVDASRARRASDWLVRGISTKNPLVGAHDVDFWEGDTLDVRRGLTAEVYDVLARMPKAWRSDDVEAALTVWQEFFSAELTRTTLDPLVAAHALGALSAQGALPADSGALLERVLKARDEGHWEPSWFHSHGGRLEVTAQIVVTLTRIDAAKYAVPIRDGLRYLLAARSSWGTWHSERATAAVLRALSIAGDSPKASGGTLVVERDGVEIARKTISATDPFASGLELGRVELGANLPLGDHSVRVRYDGASSPAVKLVTRAWKPVRAASAKGTLGKGTFTVSTSAPKSARVGKPVELTVNLKGTPGPGGYTLLVSPSTLASPLGAALPETFGVSPDIRSVRQRDGWLVVEFSEGLETASFAIPFRPNRPGKGAWPAVTVRAPDGSSLSVSAGALEVK